METNYNLSVFYDEKVDAVTGGSGDIGSALINKLQKYNNKWVEKWSLLYMVDLSYYLTVIGFLQYPRIKYLMGEYADKRMNAETFERKFNQLIEQYRWGAIL